MPVVTAKCLAARGSVGRRVCGQELSKAVCDGGGKEEKGMKVTIQSQSGIRYVGPR